ncbi:Rid family detoxifying hydrolase [Leuconostoc rapi]|uniref:Rid family detoxifying hydrolase n=1 Tax=Leuconostoc rapi TaxID=1406906 RepID=UPI00195D0E1E|nr:Rid family detoxifying hydrolase [Leuconostoc rapi]MBM7435905.1 2-iminobutanoate/2-iminopropanoate deaminase [Leuconostoc rapi]
MSKKVIATTQAPKALGPYSQAIQTDHTLYISGQIGIDPETDMFIGHTTIEQTQQIFKNIDAILHTAEFSRADVVKATLFFEDLTDFASVNKLYETYFGANAIDALPARTAVQIAALPRQAKIEIEIIATK